MIKFKRRHRINVLSLFDGISCGKAALDRLGIRYNRYFASEINKYAIQISKHRHPGIIQIGDVTQINISKLPKINLLIGGSPCQGFSFAGKQLNFKDERSKLFFEFVRVLNDIKKVNPDVKFMLENVKMKKEYQDTISKYLGVEPIEINSALVSAQNRKRLYWTNIEGVEQPGDKGILLKDVVFDDSQFTWLRPRGNNPGGLRSLNGKVSSLTTSSFDTFVFQFPHGCSKGGVRELEKAPVIGTQFHNNYFPICMHNLYGGFGEKKHRVFLDKSPTIRTSAGGGHIPSLLLSEKAIEYMDRETNDGRTHWDFKHHSDVTAAKSATVVANFFKGVPYNVLKDWNCIRKFHPVECERLQTLPDNYTLVTDVNGKQVVSNTQRYKAIGNGWTVEVIAHILKGLK